LKKDKVSKILKLLLKIDFRLVLLFDWKTIGGHKKKDIVYHNV
jgi:hypothetical protein